MPASRDETEQPDDDRNDQQDDTYPEQPLEGLNEAANEKQDNRDDRDDDNKCSHFNHFPIVLFSRAFRPVTMREWNPGLAVSGSLLRLLSDQCADVDWLGCGRVGLSQVDSGSKVFGDGKIGRERVVHAKSPRSGRRIALRRLPSHLCSTFVLATAMVSSRREPNTGTGWYSPYTASFPIEGSSPCELCIGAEGHPAARMAPGCSPDSDGSNLIVMPLLHICRTRIEFLTMRAPKAGENDHFRYSKL